MKIKVIWILWAYRIAMPLTFIVTLLLNPKLAGNLLLSFWQSETAIGIWMARGWSSANATLIGIIIGDFADFNWWLLVFYDMERWALAGRVFHAFWYFIPTDMELRSWRYRLRYVAIPITCCWPGGGVWASLLIARFLRLNKWATLALVLFGNTMKNVAFGNAFAFLERHLSRKAIGAIAVAMLLVMGIFAAGKIRKKLQRGEVKLLPRPIPEPEE